jgi:hypothetical protein
MQKIPAGPNAGSRRIRLAPTPVRSTSRDRSARPARTCITCTNPSYAALEGSRKWVKAQQGWRWAEIATCHDAMVMAPEELARMLIGVTS